MTPQLHLIDHNTQHTDTHSDTGSHSIETRAQARRQAEDMCAPCQQALRVAGAWPLKLWLCVPTYCDSGAAPAPAPPAPSGAGG